MGVSGKRVLITGASSGIGFATATLLAQKGAEVIAVARRADRLAELEISAAVTTHTCDITDDGQVTELAQVVEGIGPIDVLINNAGAAFGLESVEHSSIDDWRAMFELNVIGTKRMISTFLPSLRQAAEKSGMADILTVTSTAAFTPYEGGGGYNAAKYAEHAMMQVLRLELNGEPIRVIDIAPGMVKTPEFTLNRFEGDTERYNKLYENVDGPLTAEDVAEAIVATLELPPHANVDLLTLKPVAQAAQHKTFRGPLQVRRD
jgi:NADP-dependent 3-hydroxy acid dehydrogenase YdfG